MTSSHSYGKLPIRDPHKDTESKEIGSFKHNIARKVELDQEMKGSLKVRLRSKDKLAIMAGLISLLSLQFGITGRVYADTSVPTQNQTFEINLQNENTTVADESLAYDQQIALQQKDAQIDNEVQLVRAYLVAKNSPFANYTEILLAQPNWKTILAISNSESNMGKHCYYNNCSGIFGPNGLKTYNSIPDWMVDLNNLISTHYQGWTLQQMNGVYVYPRSTNWIVASSSVYNDLTQLESQFNTQQS